MEYNIVIASDLELLATKVAAYIPMGWQLKGGISELTEGFAQELQRRPLDIVKMQHKQIEKLKRKKWIE